MTETKRDRILQDLDEMSRDVNESLAVMRDMVLTPDRPLPWLVGVAAAVALVPLFGALGVLTDVAHVKFSRSRHPELGEPAEPRPAAPEPPPTTA
jgi:hypothetical protein